MVTKFLKRVAAHLPNSLQQELRRLFFSRQIKRRRFIELLCKQSERETT